jgi:hypothetical protein
MYCLLPLLLLIRSADRSNWFPQPVRPVWGVQEDRSVRPVVRTGYTGFCVDSYPFILLCDNSCHMHHVYYFTLILHPTKLRDIGEAPWFLLNICK